jgi:hypothetical protein
MTLHLTTCHNAHPFPCDSEIKELARRLAHGRRIDSADGPFFVPFIVQSGSRDAGVVVAVLGRAVGR